MSEQSPTTSGKDRPRIRWFVRAAALAIAIALLWPARNMNFSSIVPGLSPFVLLSIRLETLNGLLAKPLALLIGCVILVRPRWFCRWLCPLGLLTEGASRLGRRWGRRPPKSIPLGQWILWLTLGGAILGWPLLLWLDPLAIFAGLFGLMWIMGSQGSIGRIITGVILGLSRAAGETAPILFTVAAFYLPELPQSVFDQSMALPYHLFVISTQIPGMPIQIQYGTVVVLLIFVLGMNLIATLIRNRARKNRQW